MVVPLDWSTTVKKKRSLLILFSCVTRFSENAITLLQLRPHQQAQMECRVLEGFRLWDDTETLPVLRQKMLRRMIVVCREFITKESLSGSQGLSQEQLPPTTVVRLGNHHLNVPRAHRLTLKAVKVEPIHWVREIREGLKELAAFLER